MMVGIGLWTFLRAWLLGSTAIALENLALRHQLAILQRSVRRPRLLRWDRILWVWLSRVGTNWRSSLVIVQPAAVLAWHRRGFQLYRRWKSRAPSVGRPRLDPTFAISSGAWLARTPPGAAGASAKNSPSSNEPHLRRLLRACLGYYNSSRPHQALADNCPQPRDVQPPALGRVVTIPQVGGLHHVYQRAA